MSVRRRLDKDPDTGEVLRERWMIDFVHRRPDGKRMRIREFPPCNTKLDAQRWEQQLRKALADGTYRRGDLEGSPAAPTLEKFAEQFIESSEVHNKPSTTDSKKKTLKNHLVPAFGTMRLDQITPAQVEAFKAEQLKQGYAKKTVKNRCADLGRLLNLAVELGVLAQVVKVKGLRVEKQEAMFLDFEEAERLLEAVDGAWRTFVLLALRTGLRVGELLALRWEDVDLKAARIFVRRTRWNGQEHSPKGGRGRRVDLSDQAVAALRAHQHLRGAYVFCQPDGKPLSHSMVKDVVPNACRRAGLAKRVTMHGLRHSFASHLAMRGVPLPAIRDLLGHADLSMVTRYAHLAPSVTREAVRMLDTASGVAPAWHRGASE